MIAIDPIDIEQSDAVYDLADQIETVVTADPDGSWTPSTMARKIKASTDDTRKVLKWMADHSMDVVASGNGAWTRYTARRR